MTEPGSISRWIDDVRAGRGEAIDGIWQRYYVRLVSLARKKLGEVPRRVADEDDVVNRAFHSFCSGAATGRFPRLSDRHDLWQVLVMLTARKAADQLKGQFREKRGPGRVRGESGFRHGDGLESSPGIDDVVGHEPSPEFAAEITEGYRELLARLRDETLQRVAVAKMEGYLNTEIASLLGVQVRTVERKLRLIREIWTEELSGNISVA
ncbi:MAG TPA: ECF-type sigma factor [Pirellulaceae bacterium]